MQYRIRSVIRVLLAIHALASALMSTLVAAPSYLEGSRNKPERLDWFRDLGFGMFIHWSVDSQVGSVISHSLVGASDEYARRFFEDLPKTFNPDRFDPHQLAALAKLAGMRYVVFTAKHHSGFCMFDTQTTNFGIMNTPYRRDVCADLFDAFRQQGIAAGVYFSPDDFWWLRQNGKLIQRRVPDAQPSKNPGLMAHDKEQTRELLTNYGQIDLIFFDGEPYGLRDLAWDLQPDIVVTRGAILTPEQDVPGLPLDEPWEACVTMGTQWQYKPTNDSYKSGGELIALLVETRAKGGNLLLNVGPKPNGELPIEQEERLREIALWMMINQECIYAVRPWIITNEGDIWFTKAKGEDTLYAIVKQTEPWAYGQWRDVVLRSVRATRDTEISVLGQSDAALEYQANVTPKTTWEQKDDGVRIHAMRAQRVYNNRKWLNPIVLKLTHVKPALAPPRVATVSAILNPAGNSATVAGNLESLGDSSQLKVGFEYRNVSGMDLTERLDAKWKATPLLERSAEGVFTANLTGLDSAATYEVRAVVKHPLLSLYGKELQLNAKPKP